MREHDGEQADRGVAPRRSEKPILTAAEAIYFGPEPDSKDRAYSARQLVQATLPHQNPRGNPPEWFRTNGAFTLSIRPGYKTDPKTGERRCIGYPYGVIPRLLLFWMTTEVIQTRKRQLELADTLSGFMRELGLDPYTGGGKRGDAKRLRDQMERLFTATISFDYSTEAQRSWLNMTVSSKGQLWWDPQSPDQGDLFGSWIELGEDFYHALLEAPVPVDMRTLRMLKQSPLALDLYTWLAYRCFTVNQKRTPAFISWKQLKAQIGAEYGTVKDFKRRVKEVLRKILAIYPSLSVKDVPGGIKISPGPLFISPR